jgi:hypothetical protein
MIGKGLIMRKLFVVLFLVLVGCSGTTTNQDREFARKIDEIESIRITCGWLNARLWCG